MKRILAIAITIISICSMIVGCTKQKEPSNQLVWCIAGVLGYQSEADVEVYQELANKMLQEQGMDYNIKMQVIAPNYGGFTKEQKKQIEESDIITIQSQLNESGNYFLPTIKECIESFEPLDAYMASEQGKRLMEDELFAMALEEGKLEETQWLLPTEGPGVLGSSLMIDQNLWKKAGMTNQDAAPVFEECDDLFAKLYEANGKKPFLKFSAMETESDVNGMPIVLPEFLSEIRDNTAGSFEPMTTGIVVVRENGNDHKVELMLETEKFEQIMNAWKRYMEKGYVTLEPTANTLVSMRNKNEIEIEYFNDGERNYVVPMAEKYIQYTAMITANPTTPLVGISAKSDKKDIAFDVLSLAIQNRIFDDIDTYGFNLCFRSDLNAEQEEQLITILRDAPKYVAHHPLPYLDMPEIAAVNAVFARYCEADAAYVKEIYFADDGDLWLEQLKERLERAGINRILEEINQHR